MTDIAIRVEGLGKEYRIGGKQEPYRTLRDSLTDMMIAPIRRARDLLRGQAYGAAGLRESIWALRDVSFEVKHGEVVGIIGRNGAGKSTLLKILARITEPSEGRVDLYGRVGALLEVGTGFHPELTGRENIYLNGAILGMTRQEINRKFDEIVAFAEVERFVDTPVKHYSSGMGLRLGFAVAAHMEPEILVVDEVLAVGDAEFQKKCLGKMGEVAGEGRTVLFVSHNMAAVRNLCPTSILLNSGHMQELGPSNEVIENYIRQTSDNSDISLQDVKNRVGNGIFKFVGFRVEDYAGNPVDTLQSGQNVTFVLEYQAEAPVELKKVSVAIAASDSTEQTLFTLYNVFAGQSFEGESRSGEFRCNVPSLPLAPGNYKFSLFSANLLGVPIDWMQHIISYQVIAGDFFGTGKVPEPKHGPVMVHHQWCHESKSC